MINLSVSPSRRAIVLGALAQGLFGAARSAYAARPDFPDFLQSLWAEAAAQNVRRETFDAIVSGLTLDPSVPKASGKQAEFDKPLQTYFHEAVSAPRVTQGLALRERYAAELASAESRFGVPGEICLAAWGMETDYGRAQGHRDVVRSLATLAYTRPDRPIFRDEFVAALVILDRGLVARDRLLGSWAGAMGNPQFLPSAYLKYAVSAAGGAAADIWTNPADVVASIANFLHAQGWAPGEPWIEEVVAPAGFDPPSLHARAPEWAALGLKRPDGRDPAGAGDAALFYPSGAGGPAFLLFPNYFVIKQYNNSDSYALSLGALAQRIGGAPALATSWPTRPINLARSDKILIQARLAALGLYDGPRDGKFGPKARDAISAYQRRVGFHPADGFATPALVAKLRGGR